MVFFIGNIWVVLTFLHSQHFQANLTESSCVPLQTKLIFYSISLTLSIVLSPSFFMLNLLIFSHIY